MRTIGLIEDEPLDEHRRRLIEEKRAQHEGMELAGVTPAAPRFPDGAQLCMKCRTRAVVHMDGCMTCLSCGDSKCG